MAVPIGHRIPAKRSFTLSGAVPAAIRATRVLVGAGFDVSPGPGRLLSVSRRAGQGPLDTGGVLGILTAGGVQVLQLTPVREAWSRCSST